MCGYPVPHSGGRSASVSGLNSGPPPTDDPTGQVKNALSPDQSCRNGHSHLLLIFFFFLRIHWSRRIILKQPTLLFFNHIFFLLLTFSFLHQDLPRLVYRPTESRNSFLSHHHRCVSRILSLPDHAHPPCTEKQDTRFLKTNHPIDRSFISSSTNLLNCTRLHFSTLSMWFISISSLPQLIEPQSLPLFQLCALIYRQICCFEVDYDIWLSLIQP